MKRMYVLFSLVVSIILSVLYSGLLFNRVYTDYVNGNIQVLVKAKMVAIDENANWYQNDGRGQVPLVTGDKLLESTVYIFDLSGEKCDLYIVLDKGVGHGERVDICCLSIDDDDANGLLHQKIYSKRDYLAKELFEYRDLPLTLLTHQEKSFILAVRGLLCLISINALGILLSFLQIRPKIKNAMLFLLLSINLFCCVSLIIKLLSL